MDNIFFLFFRRMRAPLLVLIVTYSVAILGLLLTPGQDAEGKVWHMSIFHAFYFVSYMASTIGFGEIPHAFTDGQRLWVTFSIYGTVVAWLYSIGKVLALVQDKAFQQALTERRFAKHITHIAEPFHLVCGYGETGSNLIRSLTERFHHAVAIDNDERRVSLLHLDNLRQYVPALCGDAALPAHLLEAGLQHPKCCSVVALTNHNETNLQIAITAKLLRPKIKVICRADSHDVEANMASFGTDYIIDPFDTFATHLAIALRAPCLHLLHDWLTAAADEMLPEPIYPPTEGLWVLCGYGRFGKAVYRKLKQQGRRVIVIEKSPEITGKPPDGCVIGRGTEAPTLLEANIKDAVGIVAGTDHDVNNLSIILTARELNRDLFVILRQNREDNRAVIDAVNADVVMHPSAIIANRIRVLLGMPLLHRFMEGIEEKDDAWACQLVSRVSATVNTLVPHVWEIDIGCERAAAVWQNIQDQQWVRLETLLRDPLNRDQQLPCIPLLLLRDRDEIILPGEGVVLREGDQLLFCGARHAHDRMTWTLQDLHTLGYALSGKSRSQGWLWRNLEKLLQRSE